MMMLKDPTDGIKDWRDLTGGERNLLKIWKGKDESSQNLRCLHNGVFRVVDVFSRPECEEELLRTNWRSPH